MKPKNQIYLIIFVSSLVVMFSVVICDQLLAPWPVDPDYLFGVIIYRIYLIYYLLSFLIGANIFCILCFKRKINLDFYSWSYFTFTALIITLPVLIIVVYLVSYANIIFIILTDLFSLTLVFLPTGLIFGLISSLIKSSESELIKIDDHDPEGKKKAFKKIITAIFVSVISSILSGYIQNLIF